MDFFPPQTSFIPVTVALAHFAENNSWWGNYPYWYLGSTPFRYLTGPVVPAILVSLHKIFSGASFFDLSYSLLIVSHLLLVFGWGMFAAKLSNRRQIGFLVGAFSLILPWHWISALSLSEVSTVLAQALTPWVLLAFSSQPFRAHFQGEPFVFAQDKRLASSRERKLNPVRYALAPGLFALLLLTNPVASIGATIGLIILAVLVNKKWQKDIKRVVFVIVLGWLLTLWWLTPRFWLTIFMSPSIGGRSAAGAFIWLLGILRSLIPILAAVFVVFWVFEKRDKFTKFAVSWFVVFGVLTILRFSAAPAFWLDWTSWMGEVEVGVALLAAYIITRGPVTSVAGPAARFPRPTSSLATNPDTELRMPLDAAGARRGTPTRVTRNSTDSVSISIPHFLFIIFIVTAWFFAWQHRGFWLPTKSVESRVEYKLGKKLSEIAKGDETVFLSGSTAFWLNSFFDIRQVRGGADQGSVDRQWRQAVWEVREGSYGQKSVDALRELGVKYLVVHTQNSAEFYHDFKNVEKFEVSTSFGKIYERDGDIIYEIR